MFFSCLRVENLVLSLKHVNVFWSANSKFLGNFWVLNEPKLMAEVAVRVNSIKLTEDLEVLLSFFAFRVPRGKTNQMDII